MKTPKNTGEMYKVERSYDPKPVYFYTMKDIAWFFQVKRPEIVRTYFRGDMTPKQEERFLHESGIKSISLECPDTSLGYIFDRIPS